MALRRVITYILIVSFICTGQLMPYRAEAAMPLALPEAGAMVLRSPSYEPVMIKGLKVDTADPFIFDFVMDIGESGLSGDALKEEGERLVRYFLAALTVPAKDVWVNLSPYEKDKRIPVALGQTDMGRDLLAQDYLLKQLSASMIHPERDLGREFWRRVYERVDREHGTNKVPVNTFNKVWIMADEAEVFEEGTMAFVTRAHLKVMIEEDYDALRKNTRNAVSTAKSEAHTLGSQILREIILPEIEREVNEGKNFAHLRQIFHSIILANWYKKRLKSALLNRSYADKQIVDGIRLEEADIIERIYQRYVAAYKKGVFNYIKEDVDQDAAAPRKYFSGGMHPGAAADPNITRDRAVLSSSLSDRPLVVFNIRLDADQAMSVESLLNRVDALLKDQMVLKDEFHRFLIAELSSWHDAVFKDEPPSRISVEELMEYVYKIRRQLDSDTNNQHEFDLFLSEDIIGFFNKKIARGQIVEGPFRKGLEGLLEEYGRGRASRVVHSPLTYVALALVVIAVAFNYASHLRQISDLKDLQADIHQVTGESALISALNWNKLRRVWKDKESRDRFMMALARDYLDWYVKDGYELSEEDRKRILNEIRRNLDKWLNGKQPEASTIQDFFRRINSLLNPLPERRGLRMIAQGQVLPSSDSAMLSDDADAIKELKVLLRDSGFRLGFSYSPHPYVWNTINGLMRSMGLSPRDFVLLRSKKDREVQLPAFLSGIPVLSKDVDPIYERILEVDAEDAISTFKFADNRVYIPTSSYKSGMHPLLDESTKRSIRAELGAQGRDIIIIQSLNNQMIRKVLSWAAKIPFKKKPLFIFSDVATEGMEDELKASYKLVERAPRDAGRRFINMSDKDILLLKTEGELRQLYGLGEVVALIGKDKNAAEAADQKAAVLVYSLSDNENNRLSYKHLADKGGILKLNEESFTAMVTDKKARRKQGDKGRLAVESFQEIMKVKAAQDARRLVRHLKKIMKERGIDYIHQDLPLVFEEDKAMLSKEAQKNIAPGGIDLNIDRTQIKVSGRSQDVGMDISIKDIERYARFGIERLSPVVISISPLSSVWSFLNLPAVPVNAASSVGR